MPSVIPVWIANLGEEDLSFLKRFVLQSGSLKALAKEYGVSYPTLRTRLDRLIDRIRDHDEDRLDPFRIRLRELVAEGELTGSMARQLLALHQENIHPPATTVPDTAQDSKKDNRK